MGNFDFTFSMTRDLKKEIHESSSIEDLAKRMTAKGWVKLSFDDPTESDENDKECHN